MAHANFRGRFGLLTDTLLFCGAVLVLWWAASMTQASISNVLITVDGKTYPATLPVAIDARQRNAFGISFSLDIPPGAQSKFRVRIDDCAQPMVIGDRTIKKFCEGIYGNGINFENYIASGRTDITATIKDVYGSMMQFDFSPPPSPIIIAGLLGILLWYGLVLAYQFFGRFDWYPLAKIFVVGSVLRIGYTLSTPYYLRAYDIPGHLSYISYIADMLSLPPSQGLHQWQQAPLYYILTGGWIKLNALLGRGWEYAFHDLRWISLALSMATLATGLAIGRKIFGKKPESIFFGAAIAVFPSLLFFASRISNDVLFQLTALISIFGLLRWWNSGNTKDWYILCAGIVVSILTKGSGYILVYCALAALVLHRDVGIQTKVRLTLGLCAALLVFTGWFPLYRFMTEVDPDIFPFNFGTFANKPAIGIPAHVQDFLIINPLTMFMVPFTTPGVDTYSVRFWEFFMRSAFFGQFHFRTIVVLARMLMLSAWGIGLPLLILGFVEGFRKKDVYFTPMTILLCIFTAAAIAGRVRIGCACGGDFRLVIPVVIPLGYFLAMGAQRIGKRRQSFVWALFALCGIFVLAATLLE